MSGGSPNYVVTLSDPVQGFSQAMAGTGPFTFQNLSPSLTYQYTIKDQLNNTCTLPYSLPIQTNVNASAAGFVKILLAVQSGSRPGYDNCKFGWNFAL